MGIAGNDSGGGDMRRPVAVSHLGDFIRRYRDEADLTQEQVAERSGVSQNYISQIETGSKKEPPTFRVLRRLAAVLEAPLDQMAIAAAGFEPVWGGGPTSWIDLRGRVPADSVRWTAMEARGQSVEIPKSWADQARSPMFAVDVTGDCLARLGIVDGDVVVCESRSRDDRRAIPDGTIVLARVGGEHTLKAYFRLGLRIELRNGDDEVVHTLTSKDDYQILGTMFDRFGKRFRHVRG